MFNNPEWASEEEWDAYAWFGFAVSEAQAVEAQLLIIVTALSMAQSKREQKEDEWRVLYDSMGHLTLGQLLRKTEPYDFLSEDMIETLQDVVRKRNHLAHEFFWPKTPLDQQDPSPEEANRELKIVASLFSNTSNQLEHIVEDALEKLDVERSAVRAIAEQALEQP